MSLRKVAKGDGSRCWAPRDRGQHGVWIKVRLSNGDKGWARKSLTRKAADRPCGLSAGRRDGRRPDSGGSVDCPGCPDPRPPGAPVTCCLPSERLPAAGDASPESLTDRYGYQPIETPLFEQAEVFERGVGAVTDVVEKELFRVSAGRGDTERERWALRPEPTAGMVRAYVQHGMQTLPQPVKLTLIGPMFRYDRPQAGRYRQFWQFDVEAFGDPGPAIDAEIIELALRFYAEAGLPARRAAAQLHRRPGVPARLHRALRAYFGPHAASLPELERARLVTSPLRLLDSKEPAHAAAHRGGADHHRPPVRAHAPSTSRVSGRTSTRMGVTYRLEPRLVRGLDYYTRTTFEFFPAGPGGPAGRPRWWRSVRRSHRAAGWTRHTRASASGWASTGWSWRSRRPACRPADAGPRVDGGGGRRSRRHRDPLAHRHRSCARPGSRRAPSWASASWASSSRAPAATVRTSRSSAATSSPRARCCVRDLQAGTQRPVTLAELDPRADPRSEAQHRHGAGGR